MENNNSPSYTRYIFGAVTLKHKGKFVSTTLGSPQYESFLTTLERKNSKEGNVPLMVENRPDLISDIFYDTPGYWWYILQYNGIVDPFEELSAGDIIHIPEL